MIFNIEVVCDIAYNIAPSHGKTTRTRVTPLSDGTRPHTGWSVTARVLQACRSQTILCRWRHHFGHACTQLVACTCRQPHRQPDPDGPGTYFHPRKSCACAEQQVIPTRCHFCVFCTTTENHRFIFGCVGRHNCASFDSTHYACNYKYIWEWYGKVQAHLYKSEQA